VAFARSRLWLSPAFRLTHDGLHATQLNNNFRHRARIKGAREVKCGEYLKDELKKLEKDKPEKAKAAAEHRLH